MSKLNLSVSQRTKDRIERLVSLTDASSAAEVIKRALLVYEALAVHVANGDTFYLHKSGSDHLFPFDFMIDAQALETLNETNDNNEDSQ